MDKAAIAHDEIARRLAEYDRLRPMADELASLLEEARRERDHHKQS